MAFLELERVSKAYRSNGTVTPVLRDINLSIEKGEFVAIVGYSGSGKTTLISLMAGLIEPDTGTITLDGAKISGPGPDRGIVFQNYSLLPWLTTYENVYLAVDQVFPKWSADKKKAHTEKYIGMVNLLPAREKRPAELSGGMRQRVSVARALATHPRILLLDEPLSALDALTRATLQGEIAKIWDQDKKTVVLITNDVDEGLLLADRIIPLTHGPDATLGPAVPVDLPRPRDRKTVNHDPRFKQTRHQVMDFLLGVGVQHRKAVTRKLHLPEIEPEDLSYGKRSPFSLFRRGPCAARNSRKRPWRSRPNRCANDYKICNLSHMSAFLTISRLTKIYATPKGPAVIVRDFDLDVHKGEFVCLIGHSGCGKTTVLSMLAGLTEVTSGVMVLAGKEIKGPGPDRGMVFQSPCLLPWLSAFGNVMLGVDQVYYTASRTERHDLAEYYLSLVGLADAMHRRPAELSQGMRQRVGIARAFALAPKMLLLDEPFGMLDSLTRFELQKVLLDLWGRDQKTAFMVTHDVDEALYLADRVVMMTNGPEAEVGEILNVHFPRPRDRKDIMDHPDYYRLREHLITFLEERAEKKRSIAPDSPPPVNERIVDLAPPQYQGRNGLNPTGASLHGNPKRAESNR